MEFLKQLFSFTFFFSFFFFFSPHCKGRLQASIHSPRLSFISLSPTFSFLRCRLCPSVPALLPRPQFISLSLSFFLSFFLSFSSSHDAHCRDRTTLNSSCLSFSTSLRCVFVSRCLTLTGSCGNRRNKSSFTRFCGLRSYTHTRTHTKKHQLCVCCRETSCQRGS